MELFCDVLEIDKYMDSPVRQLSLGQRVRGDLAAVLLTGATRNQVLIYGVFGAIFTSFVTRDGCQNYISTKIRDGVMDVDLLKPIGLQMHMFMRDFSQKFSKLILVTLPTLTIFILITRLFFAVNITDLLLFILSGTLAYIILFSINFLFGMVCFFTLSI